MHFVGVGFALKGSVAATPLPTGDGFSNIALTSALKPNSAWFARNHHSSLARGLGLNDL
jgi:hypothetical protein